MKSSIAAFVLLIGLCVLPARADQASKVAQIDEIFVLTKMDHIQQQVMDQVKSMVPSFMTEYGVPAEARKMAEDLGQQIAELCQKKLSWEKMKPAYERLYAETFSEDEVTAILAFYKTPGGQALVNKTPTMMTKSMSIVQDEITELMPEVNRLTREYIEKYEKSKQQPRENQP